MANTPHYRLADDTPPKRRPVPTRPAPTDEYEPAPDTFFDRVMGSNPFLIILAVVVLTWVVLGLLAMKWPVVGLALVLAGLATIVVGQIYLYALIFHEGGTQHGLLSFFCDWYRLIYLHMNIELTLKPNLIMGCGLFMILTGAFTFLSSLRHAATP